MTALTLPARVTLDDLITEALNEITGNGTDVATAARKVLSSLDPDSDATGELLIAGFASRIHAALAEMRHMSDEVASERFRYTMRTKHGKAARTEYLERLWLEGSDGLPKSVLSFSDADCAAYIAKAVTHLNGWERKREAMETARAALAAHGAHYITGLPADALAAVRMAMQEAWR